MNNFNTLINKVMQKSTGRDLSFLALIVIFVFSSLPVTIMGNEDIAHYFFTERTTKTISTVDFCLSANHPCQVELNQNSQLNVTMPALVSISDAFDVTAKISGSGANVERVTITFKGVGHSHGLLPQTMEEVSPHVFKVKGKLSYCGYKKMNWLALVTVYTERTVYETSFTFKSVDSRVDELTMSRQYSPINNGQI